MIEIGKTYKTIGGGEVMINSRVDYPEFYVYKGSNHMDYNEEGEATFVLMYKGRFKSETNDIKEIIEE